MKLLKSNYFKFKNDPSINNFWFSEYKGWNGLIIMKLNLQNNSIIENNSIKSKYFDVSDKEKIIILVKGNIEVKSNNKTYSLNEFDAVNFYADNTSYTIKSNSNSQIFIISADKLKPQKKDPIFFNFLRDIEPKDIWGGQCISRVFFGESLNVVLFDLKNGFKFNDTGHENEQITWVIKGDMDFYVENVKEKLTEDNGVDIGSFQIHGGVSNGAIGFDAFYPKREEKKYKTVKS